MPRTHWTALAIDDVLAETFPASDPPAWTPGMARPAPEMVREVGHIATTQDETRTHSTRTFAQGLRSLLGAAGFALLVPLVILAVGTPVVLGFRGVVAVAKWLLTLIR